jgi:hypothetical protein
MRRRRAAASGSRIEGCAGTQRVVEKDKPLGDLRHPSMRTTSFMLWLSNRVADVRSLRFQGREVISAIRDVDLSTFGGRIGRL